MADDLTPAEGAIGSFEHGEWCQSHGCALTWRGGQWRCHLCDRLPYDGPFTLAQHARDTAERDQALADLDDPRSYRCRFCWAEFDDPIVLLHHEAQEDDQLYDVEIPADDEQDGAPC